MTALLRKEWRENRKLLWAFVVLAPALSLALKKIIPNWEIRPDMTFTFLAPAFVALYVMAIGADLVAGDAGSGRLVFLATLPVRPATLWAAKVSFLLLTATLFLGYVLTVETVIFSVAGRDLWLGFTGAQATETAMALAVVLALAAAVVFWSTIIDHGLAAVLGGLLTLGALGLGAWFVALSRYEFKHATSGTIVGVLAVPTVALLVGSFLSFTRGRIHLGSRLRRVALATAALVVIVGAPGAFGAARLARWGDVRPGDEDVYLHVSDGRVSPDGRWVVVSVQRAGTGPFGASRARNGAHATVALDTIDGRLIDLTGLGDAWHDPFPEPGVLRLYRSEAVPDRKGEAVTLEVLVDLETGDVRHTRALPSDWRTPWTWEFGPWRIRWRPEGSEILREGDEPVRIPKGWHPFSGHGPIGVVASGPDHERTVFLMPSGRRIELPAWNWSGILLPSSEAGDALGVRRLTRERYEVVRLPLGGGPEEMLLDLEKAWVTPGSPDGRRSLLLCAGTGEIIVLDADRGVTRIPWRVPRLNWSHLIWSTDSERFLLRLERAWVLGDLTGPEPVLAPVDLGVGHAEPIWFDGRRALVLDGNHSSLRLVAPGAEPHTLLPVR